MSQIEAGACGKPVIGIRAMGMLDTLVHNETAFLATVAQAIILNETILGNESGFAQPQKIVFNPPRLAEYRASIDDLSEYLTALMNHPELREKMGWALREQVVKNFDYRLVAKRFGQIIGEKLGIR